MKEKKIDGLKIERIITLVLSFIIPIIIFTIASAKLGCFPNGNKTLVNMDSEGQYMEFIASLKYIMNSDSSLFYSWSRSMGGNAMGLYTYYLGSPLSLITLLFPASKIYVAIQVIILIKLGLCGLSFAIFTEYGLRKIGAHSKDETGNSSKDKSSNNSKTKSKNISKNNSKTKSKNNSKNSSKNNSKNKVKSKSEESNNYHFASLSTIAFAICYALMSYNVTYFGCFMWLDGVIMLPLVCLGIERIITKKKPDLFFIIALAASVYFNYYTGYMISIFSIFYALIRVFGTYSFKEIKNALKAFFSYAVSGIIAGLLSTPILLPVIWNFKSGKLATNNDWTQDKYFFKFTEIFNKFLNGKYDSITNTDSYPAVFCGYLMLAFAVVYLIVKNIKILEKILTVGTLAFLLFSCTNVQINKLWHGNQMTHWFPYRFTFLISFILIFAACRGFISFQRWILSRKKVNVKAVALGLMSVVVVFTSIDMYYNSKGILKGLNEQFPLMEKEKYDDFYNKTAPLVKEIKKDKSFYRADKDYEFSKNDSMIFGYNGMTNYSSAYNANVNEITPKLGIAQSWYWNSGYGATPIMDSVFDVKYRMCQKDMCSTYTPMTTNEDVTLFENSTVLPIAFSASEKMDMNRSFDYDVFNNQNFLMSDLVGEYKNYFYQNNFTRTESTDGTAGFDITFVTIDANPVYLFMDKTATGWGTVYVNDEYRCNFYSTETTCSMYIGEFAQGATVTIKVRSDNASSNNIWLYSLDLNLMRQDFDALNANGLDVTYHKAGRLKGKINVDDGQDIFTSIPYDDGYIIKVDGKKVDYKAYSKTFIVIPAEKGEHELSISYFPPGLLVGIFVALFVVVLLIIYFNFDIIRKKFFETKKEKNNKQEE